MEPTLHCPDCEQNIPASRFVEHREQEHPPAPKTLAVTGIRSQEAHGYQPPDEE